jgi:hypothetical protein
MYQQTNMYFTNKQILYFITEEQQGVYSTKRLYNEEEETFNFYKPLSMLHVENIRDTAYS